MEKSTFIHGLILGVSLLLFFSGMALTSVTAAQCGGIHGECANPVIDKRLADAHNYVDSLNIDDARKSATLDRLELQNHIIYDERHIFPADEVEPEPPCDISSCP